LFKVTLDPCVEDVSELDGLCGTDTIEPAPAPAPGKGQHPGESSWGDWGWGWLRLGWGGVGGSGAAPRRHTDVHASTCEVKNTVGDKVQRHQQRHQQPPETEESFPRAKTAHAANWCTVPLPPHSH